MNFKIILNVHVLVIFYAKHIQTTAIKWKRFWFDITFFRPRNTFQAKFEITDNAV